MNVRQFLRWTNSSLFDSIHVTELCIEKETEIWMHAGWWTQSAADLNTEKSQLINTMLCAYIIRTAASKDILIDMASIYCEINLAKQYKSLLHLNKYTHK